ncbi:MAG: 2-dehydro-3-deoxygalactonokinase [Blautia wexlerae]
MILVLPGSHNKFVAVNADKEITGCLTSISGELLSAIINDTIIVPSQQTEAFVTAGQYDRKQASSRL